MSGGGPEVDSLACIFPCCGETLHLAVNAGKKQVYIGLGLIVFDVEGILEIRDGFIVFFLFHQHFGNHIARIGRRLQLVEFHGGIEEKLRFGTSFSVEHIRDLFQRLNILGRFIKFFRVNRDKVFTGSVRFERQFNVALYIFPRRKFLRIVCTGFHIMVDDLAQLIIGFNNNGLVELSIIHHLRNGTEIINQHERFGFIAPEVYRLFENMVGFFVLLG